MSGHKSSLVLADVDGTLVTEQKILTERAQAAVRALRVAGIQFAITSGRPPRGKTMLFAPLALDTPVAGFNGGLFVEPDLTILREKTATAVTASYNDEGFAKAMERFVLGEDR